MPAFSAYLNVWNTCLVILQQKGFRTWTDEEQNNFYAEKDGWDYIADDPIQLLGLVAIHEYHKPVSYKEYWWRITDPQLIESLPNMAPEFTSILHHKKFTYESRIQNILHAIEGH